MSKQLTDRERDLRATIRGYLLTATREELRKEMLLSRENGDTFRESVIAEIIAEEAEETSTGIIEYPIDLASGEVRATLRYRYVPGEEPEVIELTDWEADNDTIGELVEYYIRNEPGTCEDVLAAIRDNEQ